MLSVVIPAFNEEEGIGQTLVDLQGALKEAGIVAEIIVVDDGSTDRTGLIASQYGATVIRHPANAGYGRSLKDGILRSRYDVVGITDADGTYPVYELPRLVKMAEVFDMVVGARTGPAYRGSVMKFSARWLFRFLVEFATGRAIPDINSGLRVFRKDVVARFLEIASDRFSFTTTITLALLLNGYFVHYVPIAYSPRIGVSKINHYRDTLRAAQGIVQAILYYNPLKLFLLPVGFLALTSAVLAVFAIVTQEYVVLLGVIVTGVGAIIMGGIGLVADLMRRSRLPR